LKKFFAVGIFFLIIFTTCSLSDDDDDDDGYGTFYAQNLTNNQFYKLKADLLAEGKYCNVWVEDGSGVTADTANAIANTYDNKIYNKMIDTFGYTENGATYNTMELADALTDKDGKLTILLLDIQDGYSGSGPYTAGYFWSGNMYERVNTHYLLKYSNQCDMIYIDIYPGDPTSDDANSTLAHEMQHLMNYCTTLVKRSVTMDTWIDEGLSSAAEWLYLGNHSNGRVGWYNNDSSGLIRKGNNFFVWDNRSSESSEAVLDDYATVYLFFQWLRLQSGSTYIYKDIISSANSDYKAVTRAFNYNDDWNTVLKTWLAANNIQSTINEYGYKNDTTLNNLKKWSAPTSPTTIYLAPGEGVYSKITSALSVSDTGNIKYVYISGSTIQSSAVNSGVLLTYNSNTDNKAGTETGNTTGVALTTSIIADNSRSVSSSFTGPYRISAGDMLRRNGFSGNEPVLKLPENFRINIDD